MNASTRRTALAAAVVLAFAGAAFFGGGYAFGLLSDQERADASIRAASDFGGPPADDTVSFAGCGQVRLDLPEDASFSLTVTLYDAATDDQSTVTVTEADAGSPASGFWYHSGQDRYRFVAKKVDSQDGVKILAAELDGERYENDRECAKVGSVGTATTAGSGETTTTAGNDGSINVETDGTTTTAGNDEATNVGNDGTTTIGAPTVDDAGDGTDTPGDDSTSPSETNTAADAARSSATTEATTVEATTAEATTVEATSTEVTTANTTTAEPTTAPETKTMDDGSSQS